MNSIFQLTADLRRKGRTRYVYIKKIRAGLIRTVIEKVQENVAKLSASDKVRFELRAGQMQADLYIATAVPAWDVRRKPAWINDCDGADAPISSRSPRRAGWGPSQTTSGCLQGGRRSNWEADQRGDFGEGRIHSDVSKAAQSKTVT
jgi:hypothetical protein